MKSFTINDIISWNPYSNPSACYDPRVDLSENWTGTAIDILNIEKIPFQTRLWVVLRPELVSERLIRLFAVWCVRKALGSVTNPDPRSIHAANIAERYANGEATEAELREAESIALAAVESAYSPKPPKERAAANAALYSTQQPTLYSSIGQLSAMSAACSAWAAEGSAEWSTVWATACSTQRDKLIEMIKEENK